MSNKNNKITVREAGGLSTVVQMQNADKSAVKKMYDYLCQDNSITTRSARRLFKVENVADVVYTLRNRGVVIYTNRGKHRGVFSYRIGNPNSSWLKNWSTRHIARARRALYKEALFS